MRSVNIIILSVIENTRKEFFSKFGKDPEDEKKLFINWYIQNNEAPLRVLVNDLSDYYLHISERQILRYLNE